MNNHNNSPYAGYPSCNIEYLLQEGHITSDDYDAAYETRWWSDKITLGRIALESIAISQAVNPKRHISKRLGKLQPQREKEKQNIASPTNNGTIRDAGSTQSVINYLWSRQNELCKQKAA